MCKKYYIKLSDIKDVKGIYAKQTAGKARKLGVSPKSSKATQEGSVYDSAQRISRRFKRSPGTFIEDQTPSEEGE